MKLIPLRIWVRLRLYTYEVYQPDWSDEIWIGYASLPGSIAAHCEDTKRWRCTLQLIWWSIFAVSTNRLTRALDRAHYNHVSDV